MSREQVARFACDATTTNSTGIVECQRQRRHNGPHRGAPAPGGIMLEWDDIFTGQWVGATDDPIDLEPLDEDGGWLDEVSDSYPARPRSRVTRGLTLALVWTILVSLILAVPAVVVGLYRLAF